MICDSHLHFFSPTFFAGLASQLSSHDGQTHSTPDILVRLGWDDPAYHLEGDPEGRLFSELLVDVVAAEVIEPWGGGKWHMEIVRTVNPEPEDWNGEM